MYVVVSLEYLEKFILPIDEKSGRYNMRWVHVVICLRCTIGVVLTGNLGLIILGAT
jgi:hypothetical protein